MSEKDEIQDPIGKLDAVLTPDGDIGELRLADLIDAPALQSMMEDFYELTRIPTALIDLGGEVVVGAGWQDVCTRFHRVNPEACANCIESDTILTAGIPEGEAKVYKCKNGLWDVATPILIGGKHVGNVFTGQFFFDDEPVDLEFFRAQARRYGFDEKEYLEAIEAVPRLGRKTLDTGIRFLVKLSNMISRLSFSNVEITRSLRVREALAEQAQRQADERRRAEEQLRAALDLQRQLTDEVEAERRVLQAIMENTDTHLAYLDPDFGFVAVNSTYARGSGHTEAELLGRNHFELFPNDENEAIFKRVRETGEAAEYHDKPFEFADQPWRGITYWDWRLTPVKEQDGRLQGFAFSLVDVTRSVREKRYSDALNHLNDVIHSTLDFDSVVAQFVPKLAPVIGCEAVAVSLRTHSGEWRILDAFGLPVDVKGRSFDERQLPAPVEGVRSKTPVVIDVDDPRVASGLARSLGIRSLLIAPLTLPAGSAGAIIYGYVSGPGTFDSAQMDFAGKVAASLSLAYQNSRLFEAEQAARRQEAERAERILLLKDVADIAVSSLDVPVIAQRFAEVAHRRLNARAVCVLLADREKGVLEPAGASGLPDGFWEQIGPVRLDSDAGSARTYLDAKTHTVEDFAAREDATDICEQGMRRLDARALAEVPLGTGKDTVGVASFVWAEPRRFEPDDVTFLESLAGQVAVGLRNARSYEREHDIADRLQEALLSLPEEVPGIDFGHAYHSATEAARVGGDFYDLFELGDDRIGITIGDVAGKGLDAAVLTSLVKNTIRAHASEKGKAPSRILGLTNDVVYRTTSREAFVTVFFGVLDRRSGRLAYASAGHTTAAVAGGDGTSRRLNATGPLLGAFSDVEFSEAEVRLGIGELLFLYTDGLTEARRDGEQYGEERLFAFLSVSEEDSPPRVVDAVLADVISFTGNRLRDDLAVLAVKRVAHETQGAEQSEAET